MNDEELELLAAAAKGTAAGATESFHALVRNLLGGASAEIGAELTSSVQRWRAALDLGRRASARLEGLRRRPIARNVLFPVLEYATLEDRQELIDLWIELLATAGTAGRQDVDRVYVEILKDLTPPDARVLHWVRSFPPELDGNDPRMVAENSYVGPAPEAVRPRVTKITAMQALGISAADFELVASRLARLGLCEPGPFIFPTRIGSSATGPRIYDAIALTPLGIAFVDACSP